MGAFAGPGCGPLGWVDDVGVHLPTASGPRQVPFAGLDLPEQWPQVPIVYGCVEPEPLLLNTCLDAGVAGLVFTGTGAGQLSAAERSALEAWPEAAVDAAEPTVAGRDPFITIPRMNGSGSFPRAVSTPRKPGCCCCWLCWPAGTEISWMR